MHFLQACGSSYTLLDVSHNTSMITTYLMQQFKFAYVELQYLAKEFFKIITCIKQSIWSQYG